ncbi:hypothetical protein V490_06431 [Pseudogymnoascus sp. VKM F-3557]|nr:hypothetical protein V490_06431 [Pseudogymnoascus sp. VKM F-3557]
MTQGEGSDNVHTTNAASGRSSHGNLPSVDAAAVQSTAAKNAKRAHGFTIAIGASRRLNDEAPPNLDETAYWPSPALNKS